MPCISCNKQDGIIKMKLESEDWLSLDQVKEICLQCYENMTALNITRVKKSALMDKLGLKAMKFYEVIYTGPANSKFNFGGHALNPKEPKYFLPEEMPFTDKQLDKMPEVTYSLVELAVKPDDKDAKAAAARLRGSKGIMWVGMSSKRVNEFGTFIRDEPRFDIRPEDVDALRVLPGFKVIG